MRTIILCLIATCCVIASCNEKSVHKKHLGDKLAHARLEMDSLVADAFFTSGRGNFYLQDSIITFADVYYCTFFHFNANTGDSVSQHFRRGNGPNELTNIMYAYPILFYWALTMAFITE